MIYNFATSLNLLMLLFMNDDLTLMLGPDIQIYN